MATFIVRRLVAAFFIVIGASFIVYMMMANAGDPLAFTAEISNASERAAVRASVSDSLNLDANPVARYFLWLGDALRGDFGISARTQQPVIDDLASRIPLTLKLVTAAAVLSILVGTAIGIITALRQYSGFDYLTTFFTFVFFALPVFWVAVILKGVGGINFNDWLRDGAHFPPWLIVLGGLAAAGLAYSIAGGRPIAAPGDRRRRWRRLDARPHLRVGDAVAARPGLRPVRDRPVRGGHRLPHDGVMAGVRNRRAFYSALTTAGIGVVLCFPLQAVFDATA